jgi:CRISPR-associated endonuclease/helicase Cas3
MREAGADVLHLSTALAPADRDRIIERVRARLSNDQDTEWTLAATSCVEAGVDFSFASGIRESCSLASLVQTGGRVNRHGKRSAAEVWDVRVSDRLFNEHPAFRTSRQVLAEMLARGIADDVTEALLKELRLKDVGDQAAHLVKSEGVLDFREVGRLYRVIDSDTRTVVVDRALVARLEAGQKPPWRDLLRGSVQMWTRKVAELGVLPIAGTEELYYWTGPYDPAFLGYMAGVLPLIEGRDSGFYV